MRVWCMKCGAQGSAPDGDAAKVFKCPRCGGAMRATRGAPTPQPARRSAPTPPPPGAGTGRFSARRRRRRRFSIGKAIFALLVIAAGTAGGFYYYKISTQPSPGARALGLLPASTLAAASVEDFDGLEARFLRAAESDKLRLEGALAEHRARLEALLADALGVPVNDASRVLAATGAGGFGIVPVAKDSYVGVVVLALKNTSPFDRLLGKEIRKEAEIGRLALYKGGVFVAKFGDVVALCRERQVIEQMADAFLLGGANLLGKEPDFVAARSEHAREGRAWFYVASRAVREGAAFAALGATANISALLPPVGPIAGHLKLVATTLEVSARIPLLEPRGLYSELRLPPGPLSMAEFAPADAEFVATVLLGDDPRETYRRVLAALDPLFEKHLGGFSLRHLIRKYERQAKDVVIESDVLPLLGREVGVFATADAATPKTALLISVTDPRRARETADRLVRKLLNAEPKSSVVNNLTAWTVPGIVPLTYAFANNVMILGLGPDDVRFAQQAIAMGRTLTRDAAFQRATAILPSHSTAQVVVREGAAATQRRHGEERASLVIRVALNESDIAVAASVPNVPQALMAIAPMPPPPAPTPEPSPEDVQKAELAARQANIAEIAGFCRKFLTEKGEGARYPRGMADLMRSGYITGRNMSILIRPGDTAPERRSGLRTSYEMAFDAVKSHRFTADTPGTLPMVWEIASPPGGQRLVAYFDGTVKPETATEQELIQRLRDGLPPPPEPPKEPPPEKPPDEPPPPKEPEEDKPPGQAPGPEKKPKSPVEEALENAL